MTLPTWQVRKAGFKIYTRDKSDGTDTLMIQAATREEAIAEFKRRAGITRTTQEPDAVLIDPGTPESDKHAPAPASADPS